MKDRPTQTTLKFPIHFQAKPRRARGLRDIVVSYPFEVDIPEISRRETNLVFETRETLDAERGMASVARIWQMLERDGRLYRRLATRTHIEAVTRNAFSKNWDDAQLPFNEGISLFDSKENTNPVANAIQRQIGWRLQGDSTGRDRKENTWPTAYARSAKAWGITESLNGHLYGAVLDQLADVDADAVSGFVEKYEHQASKLLIVDGELWIESLPPSICVQYDYTGNRQQVASVYLAVLPEGPTQCLETVCFPLDRHDEALQYAGHLARAIDDGRGVDVSDALVPFKADGGGLFDFSPEEIELRNLCHHLTVSTERSIRVTDPEFLAKFMTDSLREEQARVFELAMRADFVAGKYEDLTGWFDMTATLWKKCRRPSYQFRINGQRKQVGDLLLARGYENLENAPISLITNQADPTP
ncbi:hypothetical protein [Rhizobium sp. BK176]|uniref:hypothetical protein n=1 Tax=Rhizobium sp. BK176 TaxID=2587071 RepID=UPI0021681D2D|nr:hypothetical protein [Rhizobium sp. BK176]MCS4090200.1 hypothetical protein [Rhizobium sp. BK176]